MSDARLHSAPPTPRDHEFNPARRLGEAANIRMSEDFRLAMRELASGVCVVTTGEGISRSGLTATSVSSLSVAPASLLVSIQCSSAALKKLRSFGAFGVNLLSAQQRDIADRFSGRTGLRGEARFDCGKWSAGLSGVPLLPSALAAIECTVESIMKWHTHCVVVGAVSSVTVGGDDDALIYWRGAYGVAGTTAT